MSDHSHSHDHHDDQDDRRVQYKHLLEKYGEDLGEAFWDELYGLRDQVWTGNVNHQLPSLVDGLPLGTAIDVGCGEGGDAIFLAEQGWKVMGIDITQVALDRAAKAAVERGLAVEFRRVNLLTEVLTEQFDLVSAFFMHTMYGDPYALLRSLPALVKPNGSLVIVGHAGNADAGQQHVTGWRASDVADALGLDGWTVDIAERRHREGVEDPNGHTDDEVFRATRPA